MCIWAFRSNLTSLSRVYPFGLAAHFVANGMLFSSDPDVPLISGAGGESRAGTEDEEKL